MGNISVSLPSDGTTADVSDYNNPINAIVNEFNGNIDNTNIKSGAAIDGSKLAALSIPTTAIQDGAVTFAKLDPTSLAPVYDNIVTSSGKTYNITEKGIYMAWGVASNTTGNPILGITMNSVVKARAVASPAGGNWSAATAIAVGLVDNGQTIVVDQTGASTTDNRSSVGMCLIQRVP